MKPHLLLTTVAMCLFRTITAQIIHVPGDQPSIQAGIDAASDGDTVLVDEGTYYENIDFIGKAITVASWFIIDSDSDHIEYTVIDGSQPVNPDKAAVVTFNSGEDTTSMICGFTITGGGGNFYPSIPIVGGGGIACDNSGATICDNHIEYNTIETSFYAEGAGIGTGPPDADIFLVIRNNRIRHNTLSTYSIGAGGGMSIRTDARIINNEITDNMAESISQYVNGGGLYSGGWNTFNTVEIRNNIITGNELYSSSNIAYQCSGGGVFIYKNHGEISNNMITGNSMDGTTNGRGAGVCIAITDTTLELKYNRITDNYFVGMECLGGGINFWGAGAKVVNNLIAYNTASLGGGIYSYDEHTQFLQIINNTITENEAEEIGGGLYLWGSDAIVMNTILWNDFANFSSEIVTIDSQLGMVYSNVDGGWTGEGNMNEDPEFVDDTMFHISWSDSPCWDAGIDQIEIGGIVYYAPDRDLEGETRPGDAYVDIGADEDIMWEGVEELQAASFRLQVFPNPAFGRSEIRYQIAETKDQLAVGSWQ
ncbi:MAG TPA: right-handed parallel beta-helix repeat-containing protein [Bacteroidales bacterium]|nr:right-handed parallel beta-helix repeat-containing protein [Bacteroidales bacterium]HNS46654.1 right-handed parallel beta-helix repeat-containing protein [Bacteroidales bacterium]